MSPAQKNNLHYPWHYLIKPRNSINVLSVIGILNLGLHANLKYDLEFFYGVMLFSENNKEMQHFDQ